MDRFIVLALICAVAWSAHAANFTVTNTNDSGPGSLRDAIAQANATPGANSIDFGVTGTITLTSGQLQITQGPLTITGPGAASLTIDGKATNRLFLIRPNTPATCPALVGPTDYLVTLSGLTLQNGTDPNNAGGGAILSFKSLALDAVIIQNNHARVGGGVFVLIQHPGQLVTINNSQFLNNISRPGAATAAAGTQQDGGALFVVENCLTTPQTAMTATISNSAFIGNRAQPTSLNGRGGAISLYVGGSVDISDSRFVDNHVDLPATSANAGYQGGAIRAYAKSLSIVRSEISENSADTGAGVYVFNPYLSLQGQSSAMAFQVINSTIANNVANTTQGAISISGNVAAAVYNSTVAGNYGLPQRTNGIGIFTGATFPASSSNADAPTLKVVSSIISNPTVNAADIGVSLLTIQTPYHVDATNSLVGNPGLGVVVPRVSNLVGASPYLGPLMFNGGPSRTMAPVPTSLVIDRGANPLGLTTDQRGPGFPRVQKAAADMGAYEGNLPFLPGLGFLPPTKYSAAHPSLRVAADLTGNGLIDLASVNSAGNTADVLINNGDGTFTAKSYTVGSQPSTIVTCDVNGDNLRDLITVDTGSNTLSILINQGNGTFALAHTLPTGNAPTALTCQANLTSPLRHNLEVVNSGDNTLMQFQDDGAGNFTLQATVPVGANPVALATSDLDFDNFWDHVSFNSAGNSVTVLHHGPGFTYTATDYPVQAGPVSGSLVDVSGDGFLDIVTDNSAANSISVLINAGKATFKPAVSYAVGANPRAHTTGDFDGDGSLDIAVRNAGSNDIAVLINNGDGTFKPAVFYPVGGSPASISVADFNSDGIPDLIAVVPSLNGVAVLYGNGDGTFQPAVIIPVGLNPSFSVQVADLNGDGRPDIAVPLLGEDKIAILLNATDFRLGPAERNNYQGLWWKSPPGSESGWGISIAHEGDTVVATWLTYGANGKPLWMMATLARTSTNAYSGPIMTATGPPFDSVPFDSNSVVRAVVGSMTITFFGDDNAYFAYTVGSVSQSKTITRQDFASPVPSCSWGAQPDLTLATNFQDRWFDNAEPGWEINFAHQGNVIVATWATYGADGMPLWFFVTAPGTGTNVYAGPIYTTTGPSFDAVPWDPTQVVATAVGNATFTFTDGNHATFDYTVKGTSQSKGITRKVFVPPGTVCF